MTDATTLTTNLFSNGEFCEYFQEGVYRSLDESTCFMEFSKKERQPNGTQGYVISFLDEISSTIADVTLQEGVKPDACEITYSQKTINTIQLGKVVRFSDLVLQDAKYNLFSDAAYEIGRTMGKHIDDYVREQLDLGTQVVYAGGAANEAAITATDLLTSSDIGKIYTQFSSDQVKRIGGAYIALAHPFVLEDLRSAAGGNCDFCDVMKNTVFGQTAIINNVIGKWKGIVFVEAPCIQPNDTAGAGGQDLYTTYFFGMDAYTTVMSQDPTFIYKALGSAGTEDPLNQCATVGMKTRFGTCIIREKALIRFISSTQSKLI